MGLPKLTNLQILDIRNNRIALPTEEVAAVINGTIADHQPTGSLRD